VPLDLVKVLRCKQQSQEDGGRELGTAMLSERVNVRGLVRYLEDEKSYLQGHCVHHLGDEGREDKTARVEEPQQLGRRDGVSVGTSTSEAEYGQYMAGHGILTLRMRT
jgi:hypothetical protein